MEVAVGGVEEGGIQLTVQLQREQAKKQPVLCVME